MKNEFEKYLKVINADVRQKEIDDISKEIVKLLDIDYKKRNHDKLENLEFRKFILGKELFEDRERFFKLTDAELKKIINNK